ncbi:MAG: TetR/AcrR family transcriptional regulator [Acidobacteria bacterium]|nr:TetR/AcrR family transcriptional regulator [Acidobacteriota bacterium]
MRYVWLVNQPFGLKGIPIGILVQVFLVLLWDGLSLCDAGHQKKMILWRREYRGRLVGGMSKREHLIKTAIDLFQKHGFHATGVNAILEASGISKKTMYRYFRSKDELVLAALRHQDGVFRNFFMREVEKTGPTPRERLMGIFDVAERWFCDQQFYGCIFINAVGEHANKGSPVRQVSRDFKAMMRGYILELCQEAGLVDPESTADRLAILLEGAIVTAQVSGRSDAARTAKSVATMVLSTGS